jgi:hypothetical protein
MLKQNYLSEVETLWVSRAVVVDEKPKDRLISVYANVGTDVHGFAAVVESTEEVGSSWLVKFSPVTDIAVIRSRMERFPDGWDEHMRPVRREEYFDALKLSPTDHACRFCGLSKWVDTDKISDFTPTIGVDVDAGAPKDAVFYAIASLSDVEDAPKTGVIKGRVGYMVLYGPSSAEEQLRRRYALFDRDIELITCQVMNAGDAAAKERLVLSGLRAAFRCAQTSEWFELPYSVDTEWEIGQGITAALIDDFEFVGQDFENGLYIGTWP